MAEKQLHVAIIGGGLCGLSLAIGLTQRSISYTIYEGRASFTDIGAGINLGPNTIQALNLVDPTVTETLLAMGTKNPKCQENTWMNLHLGAPTKHFEDGHFISGIVTPTTGFLTTSRNELLQLLGRSISPENARFNKKLAQIQQSDDAVTMIFEDGTRETASLVIGCDGAHSTVRRILLGPDSPATKAKYSETGGYRAVFPMHVHEKIVGAVKAHMSTINLGPGGYIIHYPIDGGRNVNVGVWPWKRGEWMDEAWVIPNQKPQMLKDFEAWGRTLRKMLEAMDDDTPFWASFHHSVKPESYFDGRVCMIGDAAHGMCPHQGQGAGQSMEDACLMADILQSIDTRSLTHSVSEQIAAMLKGYESVRKPRFERVLDTSFECFSVWADFWRWDLDERDLNEYRRQIDERFKWIWDPDFAGQRKRARDEMMTVLNERRLDGAGEHRERAKLA